MVHKMYSAPNYPKCTTRWAEASLFAEEGRQMLVTVALHLTGGKPLSNRAGEQ